MKYLLFLLLPLLSFGQIKSNEAAFRFQNQYVGLSNGGSVSVIRPPAISQAETELYTIANALSRTAEADATTGLSLVGVTLASIESSPSPQDGTSLIEITSTDQNSDRFEVDLTLTSGVEYDIKYWAWEASGGLGRTTAWTGFSAFPDFDYTETPTEYTHTLTANSATQKLRFYNFSTAKAYVDGLSIKQSNPTDPGGGSIPEITLATKYAFPGAFGPGQVATGGRGGSYYTLSNLNNSGTGSFRDAVASGSRIIIPKVEGIITLSSQLTTTVDNITIWGQFAPGNGLTVTGDDIVFLNPDNHITRFITFQNNDGDNAQSAIGWREMPTGSELYIDHVSARFGEDQTLDLAGTTTTGNKFTVAYNLMGPGDKDGSTTPASGGILGDSGAAATFTGDVVFARNMWTTLNHRFFNISGLSVNAEGYNNFGTNYRARIIRTNGGVLLDWFHNYIEAGNVSKSSPTPVNKMGTPGSAFRTYTADNFVENWDETPSGNQTNLWVVYNTTQDGIAPNEPIASYHYEATRQHAFSAPVDGVWDWSETKSKVLASAGHNRGINSDGTPGFYRDDNDATYVTQATNGTTPSSMPNRSSFSNSTMTGESLYTDTDGDYMPDWFENQGFASLNAASSSDRDGVITNWDFGDYTVVNNAGYTNLEMCAAYYAGDFETILDGTNDLNLTIE